MLKMTVILLLTCVQLQQPAHKTVSLQARTCLRVAVWYKFVLTVNRAYPATYKRPSLVPRPSLAPVCDHLLRFCILQVIKN